MCYNESSVVIYSMITVAKTNYAVQYYTVSCGWWSWARCDRYRTMYVSLGSITNLHIVMHAHTPKYTFTEARQKSYIKQILLPNTN